MHRAIAPLALACAAFAALPAAAGTVSVTARTRGPAVDVYIEAQSRGVTPTYLYDHAHRERRVLPRSAPPPIGTFAYFGVGGATAVAVVTDVHVDGTVTLLHHDPYGAATELRMNLRYPHHHRRAGYVVNDYVLFTGTRALAPVVFYGYSQPPPRVVVIDAPRHGGHRGGVGPREHHEHERWTCHEPGHPGRGHAFGKCKNHGHHPRPVNARWDDDHGHHHGHWDDDDDRRDRGDRRWADRGRDGHDDHKKKNKKKHKRDKKDDGKRGDKRQDRDRDHDHRARKKLDV